MNDWLQIISFSAGLIYMTLQIFQKRVMWYFNLITASAALAVALRNTNDGVWAPIWAQALLNTYFIVMSVIGLIRWRALDAESKGRTHIVLLSSKSEKIVAAAFLIGAPLACLLFSFTNDPVPMADATAFVLSILAAWLLTRSHLEQYYFWIAADIVLVILYSSQQLWWMAALYYCYILSSFIGIIHWKKNAVIFEE